MKWSLATSAVNIVICALIGNWVAALMAFCTFCACCDLVAEIERLQGKK